MFKKKINSCDRIYNDSLDVRFTKTCDNHCAFCIERQGINSLGKTDLNKLIKTTIVSGDAVAYQREIINEKMCNCRSKN